MKKEVSLTDIAGIWKRDYIRTPDHFDDTTLVYWFQSGLHHVDIRIPIDFYHPVSTLGLTAYSQFSYDQLLALMSAEGFAGTTQVIDNVCTWTRKINFRGRLQGLDTGLLEQTPEGLIENGIYEAYSELWNFNGSNSHLDSNVKVPEGIVMESDDGQQSLYLVYTDTHFALGRGRLADLNNACNTTERIQQALEQNNRNAVAELLDMEFCMGAIDQRGGVITESTNPLRVGALAFELNQLNSPIHSFNVITLDFYGVESTLIFSAVK